jgi:hypothetical protein
MWLGVGEIGTERGETSLSQRVMSVTRHLWVVDTLLYAVWVITYLTIFFIRTGTSTRIRQ